MNWLDSCVVILSWLEAGVTSPPVVIDDHFSFIHCMLLRTSILNKTHTTSLFSYKLLGLINQIDLPTICSLQ